MFRTVFATILWGSLGLVFIQAQELDLSNIPLDDPLTTSTMSPNSTSKASLDHSDDAPTAQTVEKTPVEKSAKKRGLSFFGIIHAGGPIGYVIILLSLVSVALMIEHALTIRQKILMPPGFAEEILGLLNQGQLAPAIQKCQTDDSVLAKILYGGMSEFELGWNAVEKGAEEATAEEASRLYRKIEYLNVIGNIAPMLGLLGTVVGMVFAFQQLADSEGYARAADLAQGIYLALVTTVQGLVVAIPSLAIYSIFSNRIAYLIGETTFVAEQVLLPVKKSLYRKSVAQTTVSR